LDGFTDKIGTTDANDSLAQKRVQFVFQNVKDKVTMRSDFKSRSYGEKFTQSAIEAENRRVTIFYLLEKDLVNEDEILGIKDTLEIVIPENAPLKDKVAMAKIGTKIIIKDINFYLNTFAITPESNGALYDLLFVLQNNPNLEIQIQGHICCVSNDKRKLSLERAKQVRRFLVFKGVPQYRITVTGFGVSQPIYAIPEDNEEQAAANRRVEIEIIKK
jgi:outer membrane protein OmpA-like peptidoglycan-associated protein